MWVLVALIWVVSVVVLWTPQLKMDLNLAFNAPAPSDASLPDIEACEEINREEYEEEYAFCIASSYLEAERATPAVARVRLMEFAAVVLLPPLALLVIGWLIDWVVRGFRRRGVRF